MRVNESKWEWMRAGIISCIREREQWEKCQGLLLLLVDNNDNKDNDDNIVNDDDKDDVSKAL